MKTGNKAVLELLITHIWLNSMAELPFPHEVGCNGTDHDLNFHNL